MLLRNIHKNIWPGTFRLNVWGKHAKTSSSRLCIINLNFFFRIHDKNFIALRLRISLKRKIQNMEYAKFWIILIFQISYRLVYLGILLDFSAIANGKDITPCFMFPSNSAFMHSVFLLLRKVFFLSLFEFLKSFTCVY